MLVLTPPAGWRVAMQERRADMFVVQYVPAGQGADDWQEMIQAQVFFNVTGLAPEDYLESLLGLYREDCDPIGAGPLESNEIAGYPTSSRFLLCGRNRHDNLGEVALVKAIQGRESLYAINRAWRGIAFDLDHLPVSTEVLEDWARLIGAARLCDHRSTTAPCPEAGPE